MASVVVAGRKPFYELKAADLVVKHLDEICVVNLKQLFRNEDLVSRNVSNLTAIPCSISQASGIHNIQICWDLQLPFACKSSIVLVANLVSKGDGLISI